MSSITVRLPDSVHRKIKEVAKQDGVSINQFICSAVGEKLTSVLTLDHLEQRAAAADKKKFKAVLKKVSRRTSLDHDRL
jgi:CO dehydrogenase/acetyl-CoA synthase gamma subunit (corrinoid Fe-S protein)